jgi:glutathionylspermidine synthase
MATHYPDFLPAGDPAGRLSEMIQRAVRSAAPVGFMHMACYTEDRQVMLHLAQRLQARGLATCLFQPSQIRWTNGLALISSDGYQGPLSLVFRFYPAEWLPQLPATTAWEGFLTGGETAICNPASAILTQSKRFPLIWDQLTTSLSTWRDLLPETRSPLDINGHADGEWVFKPALGYEGKDVAISGVTETTDWQRIHRAARKNPEAWVAQRRFECLPLSTPDGLMYPCLGIYVIEGRAAGAYGRMGIRPLIDDRSREIAILLSNE